MGRSRRSRYALEFLERKLNLSTTATGIVAAEVSTTPAPDAAPTVAPVAPAPGDSSATVQSMQNSPGVASTSSDDVAHKPAENLLSAPASGSRIRDGRSFSFGRSPSAPAGSARAVGPIRQRFARPRGRLAAGATSGTGTGSSSPGGSGSGSGSGSPSGSGAGNNAMVHGSSSTVQGGGIYVSSGAGDPRIELDALIEVGELAQSRSAGRWGRSCAICSRWPSKERSFKNPSGPETRGDIPRPGRDELRPAGVVPRPIAPRSHRRAPACSAADPGAAGHETVGHR